MIIKLLIKLEKDFLLTLILIKFGKLFPNLIFKGGTCLNKIYFPYFRLSEDLDFTSKKFLDLVYLKLDEANFEYTLENKKENLVKQIQTDLLPVLNSDVNFNFDKIFDFVLSFKK